MDPSIQEGASMPADPKTIVPLAEEELHVGKRLVETGRVAIHKTVETREEAIDLPLLREDVVVERVPINQYVQGPVQIHEDGDTLVIPLLEEVLVTEKRLLLREEVRISRRRGEAHRPQNVLLRHEEAHIERLPPGTAATERTIHSHS
jgi:uncharacterized protein (TIGR02271 family)